VIQNLNGWGGGGDGGVIITVDAPVQPTYKPTAMPVVSNPTLQPTLSTDPLKTIFLYNAAEVQYYTVPETVIAGSSIFFEVHGAQGGKRDLD
jgi:hypothetical protein